MTRWKWGWLYLLGVVIVCIAVTSVAEAQCAKCTRPPGATKEECHHTFYNGANTCVTDPTGHCSHLGTCQGQLGDQCETDPYRCTFDQWGCGRPLGEEWRLESYTVEHSVARPASAKDKA